MLSGLHVLEFLELLLGSWSFGDFQYVESDGFAEGPALSDCHDITNSHIPKGETE